MTVLLITLILITHTYRKEHHDQLPVHRGCGALHA